jgi:hypothetical protein
MTTASTALAKSVMIVASMLRLKPAMIAACMSAASLAMTSAPTNH